jgi:hypothetical protein
LALLPAGHTFARMWSAASGRSGTAASSIVAVTFEPRVMLRR